MNSDPQARKAEAFRQMHDRSRVLVLPNAWDAASAKVLERIGFPAIATTSGGVAWSLGHPDGEQVPLEDVLAVTRRIAGAVDVPVTADIEAGFGRAPDDVARSVQRFIEAGVVGINLEDGLRGGGLRDLDEMVERLHAARRAADGAGVPIVINARTDPYMKSFGENAGQRFDETVRRARAYLAAGADCIYPIGLADAAAIEALVRALDAPVNVAARPGLPDVAELGRLGVARVSTATRLATLALSALERAATELHDTGRFDGLQASFTHADAQKLFARR